MIVNTITALSIVTVLERGVPNKESIAIQVLESINLGQYGIMLGTYAQSGMATPFQDNLFWFGDGIVESGDWIFIDTGKGEPTQCKASDQHNIFTLFWNKPTTIFARTSIVPMLFRVDAVDVLEPPSDLPQIARSGLGWTQTK